jgi:hypothetical protein
MCQPDQRRHDEYGGQVGASGCHGWDGGRRVLGGRSMADARAEARGRQRRHDREHGDDGDCSDQRSRDSGPASRWSRRPTRSSESGREAAMTPAAAARSARSSTTVPRKPSAGVAPLTMTCFAKSESPTTLSAESANAPYPSPSRNSAADQPRTIPRYRRHATPRGAGPYRRRAALGPTTGQSRSRGERAATRRGPAAPSPQRPATRVATIARRRRDAWPDPSRSD